MFDVGWSELLLIGVVALIVVGPEDLPRMFHALGRMTAKARAMAREFSSAMEDAAKQSGIKDATSGLEEVRSLTSRKSLGLDALDRAAERFEKWDPALPKVDVPITPDPTLRRKPSPGSPKPAAADAPKPVASATPEPAAPVQAPAAATSPAPVGAPEAEPAPGRRSLKAVRRADTADSRDA